MALLRSLGLLLIASCLACSSDEAPAGYAPHGTTSKRSDAGSDRDGGSASVPRSSPRAPVGVQGSDVFSPDKVYLFGTHEEGRCGAETIADVTTPNRGLVALTCYATTLQIDPENGDLVYANGIDGKVFAFRCDNDCRYWSDSDKPAKNAVTNDVEITTNCGTGGGEAATFLVSPEGDFAFGCNGWFDEMGRQLAMGESLLALGHDMLALGVGVLWDLQTNTRIEITGGPDHLDLIAARASDKGFRIAIGTPNDDAGPVSLWEIDAVGAATKLGDFPPAPDGEFLHGHPVLDGSYALWQFAGTSFDGHAYDTIVRRTIDGESDEVYTEADDPIVKIHISALVTGP